MSPLSLTRTDSRRTVRNASYCSSLLDGSSDIGDPDDLVDFPDLDFVGMSHFPGMPDVQSLSDMPTSVKLLASADQSDLPIVDSVSWPPPMYEGMRVTNADYDTDTSENMDESSVVNTRDDRNVQERTPSSHTKIRGSTRKQRADSIDGILQVSNLSFMQNRMYRLFRGFNKQFQHVSKLSTSSSSICSPNGTKPNVLPNRLHDVRRDSSQELHELQLGAAPHLESESSLSGVIDPQSYPYVFWLTTVTIAYLYNCFVIPLRDTFPYQTAENTYTWLFLDYTMDIVYLVDLTIVKPRLMFLENGFWVKDSRLTRRSYFRKVQFKMDLFALIPLDVLYLIYGTDVTFFRLPRLLKIQTFWEFFNHFDSVLASPYMVRVTRTLTYTSYLVHLNACAYYAISLKQGLGSNKWVYSGEGNAYLRCFYRALKTATSIGKNPKPCNEFETLFMIASWLMGVFVFAVLIGQIRDIVATASRSQTEYRKLMDETLDYLRRLNVSPKIRQRVEQWFSFTWEQQRTLDENRILDMLPPKMKTDVAINVNFKTLAKVKLFKNCDEALLRELVLKLRPVLYLPGDYICRKGEVGKEMYIVKTGQVQVLEKGPDANETVLATLTEGTVFGEISLLGLAGTNRRTADVRSHGFSSLFVLSKSDLQEAIKYYPNAYEILKKKARQLILDNAIREGKEMPAEILQQAEESSSNISTPRKKGYCPLKTNNKVARVGGKFRKRKISRTHSDSHVTVRYNVGKDRPVTRNRLRIRNSMPAQRTQAINLPKMFPQLYYHATHKETIL